MCVCFHKRPVSARQIERDVTGCACLMEVLYVGGVEGSSLCDQLSAYVWVSACTWGICSALLLVEPANGRAAAASLRPHRDLFPRALGCVPAVKQERS